MPVTEYCTWNYGNIIEMMYDFQEFQDSKPREMCMDPCTWSGPEEEQIQYSDILLLASYINCPKDILTSKAQLFFVIKE
jgi:hypothetical protein